MTEPLEQDEAPPRRCIRCDYDLRGHAENTRCPECGLAAFWSIRAPANLAQYPAGWVASMARAVKLLALGYTIAFAALIAMLTDLLGPDEVTAVVLGVAAVLQLAGVILLGRQSGHWTEARSPVLIWAMRLAALAPLAANAIAWVLMLGPSRVLYANVMIALAIVGAAAPALALFRMRRVAKMIASPMLAEHSAIVAWGLSGTIVAVPTAFWGANQIDRSYPLVAAGIVAVALLPLLLFVLWAAFVMICCVVDFSRSAKIAAAEWKNTLPPE